MKRRIGFVTGAAVAAALCLATPAGAVCPADTDRDGMVGMSDLVCVLQYYGCSSLDNGAIPNWRMADCDGDGCVGVMDLIEVLDTWGKCPVERGLGDGD